VWEEQRLKRGGDFPLHASDPGWTTPAELPEKTLTLMKPFTMVAKHERIRVRNISPGCAILSSKDDQVQHATTKPP